MDALEQIIAKRKGETNQLETYREYVAGLEEEVKRLNKLLAVADDDQLDAWNMATEELCAKDAEIAELKRPGRELSDDEIDAEIYNIFWPFRRGAPDWHPAYLHELRCLVRRAISKSRPAMCGPTAEEIYTTWWCPDFDIEDVNEFTEWYNSRVRPVAEVTQPLLEEIERLKAKLRPEVRWYTTRDKMRIWKYADEDGKRYYYRDRGEVETVAYDPEGSSWQISITEAEADAIREGWKK